jgi:hypothetical protein
MFATMLHLKQFIIALLNTITGILIMGIMIPVFVIVFIPTLFYKQIVFHWKNNKR